MIPRNLPPVPHVSERGLLDIVWPRWLDNLRAMVLSLFPQYGSFYSTATFSAVAATPSVLTLNTTSYSKGIVIGTPTSRILCQVPGLYDLQFSAQASNSGASDDDVTLWVRLNGVDVPDSAGFVSVPGKHGTTDGHACFGWNQYFDLKAGDYLELIWMTELGTTTLETYPASLAPVRPRIPSIAVTLTLVD